MSFDRCVATLRFTLQRFDLLLQLLAFLSLALLLWRWLGKRMCFGFEHH